MADGHDRAWLLAHLAAGAQPKYLFFWSHQPDKPHAYLSQWWPASFQLAGETYPTAEHYMMAAKAALFGDAATRQQILAAPHPGAAKQLGRQVAGFDEAQWQAARSAIVIAGNMAKFSQNEVLRQRLLNTGERVLVEASPVDATWGIGLAATDPLATQPQQWPGLNLLGFALMTVRDQLRGA